MTRFFVKSVAGKQYVLSGDDAKHAVKSLRMKTGEKIILCDENLAEYTCCIQKIENMQVFLEVLERKICTSEPDCKITLYQSLPKSDKMDFIVQKSIEIGVHRIIPVVTNRCISRLDAGSSEKKLARWNKISKEAAQQSQRGVIPEVRPLISLKEAAKEIQNYSKFLVFYENGGSKLKDVMRSKCDNVAFLIGPEGGFDVDEIKLLEENGAVVSTLGNRILRTETAAISALSTLIYITENE